MPTYDYECDTCNTQTELNVPIDARDKYQQCPKCKCALVRVISFKGLTWAPTAGGMR